MDLLWNAKTFGSLEMQEGNKRYRCCDLCSTRGASKDYNHRHHRHHNKCLNPHYQWKLQFSIFHQRPAWSWSTDEHLWQAWQRPENRWLWSETLKTWASYPAWSLWSSHKHCSLWSSLWCDHHDHICIGDCIGGLIYLIVTSRDGGDFTEGSCLGMGGGQSHWWS